MDDFVRMTPEELVALATQAGSRDDREHAARELVPYIMSAARKALLAGATEQERRDLLADAVAIIWPALPQFNLKKGHFVAWSSVVLGNRLRDRRRKRSPEFQTSNQLDEYEAEGAESEVEERLAWEEVNQAIEMLPVRDRIMVRLKYFTGMNQQEIAAQFGLSEATVSNVLDRARTRIQEALRVRTARAGYRIEPVLEQFDGWVTAVRDREAYITLVDRLGEEFAASCPAEKLARSGIGDGDHFLCIVKKVGEFISVEYAKVPEHAVTDAQQNAIRDDIDEAFEDYDPG